MLFFYTTFGLWRILGVILPGFIYLSSHSAVCVLLILKRSVVRSPTQGNALAKHLDDWLFILETRHKIPWLRHGEN